MADNLVVVESPAKAETIKRYLGKGFEVLASYGHVRELPSKGGSAVNPVADFEMSYSISEKSTKHVNAIIRAVKLTNNDKSIMSHSSLSKVIINSMEFVKISNMFIYIISLITTYGKKREITISRMR